MKTHKNIMPKLKVSRLPLTAAIYMALSTAALAAPDDQAATEDKKAVLDAVTVTAQKRTENLQEVPISIQVLGTQKLTEMNVNDFDVLVRRVTAAKQAVRLEYFEFLDRRQSIDDRQVDFARELFVVRHIDARLEVEQNDESGHGCLP